MSVIARLVVKGFDKGIGYRAYVKLTARSMGADGSVKNLDDGTVEIYYECPDEAVRKFKAAISKRAADPMDPLQIDVAEIEEFDENSPGFDVNRLSHPFEVPYDSGELSPYEKESLERSEMAILAMKNMNQNLSGKHDQTHGAIKEVSGNTDDMNQNITEKFDWLAERYGEFGASMVALREDMGEMKQDIHEMKDAFV